MRSHRDENSKDPVWLPRKYRKRTEGKEEKEDFFFRLILNSSMICRLGRLQPKSLPKTRSLRCVLGLFGLMQKPTKVITVTHGVIEIISVIKVFFFKSFFLILVIYILRLLLFEFYSIDLF